MPHGYLFLVLHAHLPYVRHPELAKLLPGLYPKVFPNLEGLTAAREDLAAAQWPLARPPHLLETSLPGVFAVGDVRASNIKRVASAVGEGSIAVSFVHKALQE